MNKKYLVLVGVIILIASISFYVLSSEESNSNEQQIPDASFIGTWQGDYDVYNRISFSKDGEVCITSKNIFENGFGFLRDTVDDISNIDVYGNYSIDNDTLIMNIFTTKIKTFSYSIEGNKLTFSRFVFIKESDEYEDPAVELENVSEGEEATIKDYLIDGERFIVNGFLKDNDFVIVSRQQVM
jgi:hypothetical protein